MIERNDAVNGSENQKRLMAQRTRLTFSKGASAKKKNTETLAPIKIAKVKLGKERKPAKKEKGGARRPITSEDELKYRCEIRRRNQ
jgi:hypothetical protein